MHKVMPGSEVLNIPCMKRNPGTCNMGFRDRRIRSDRKQDKILFKSSLVLLSLSLVDHYRCYVYFVPGSRHYSRTLTPNNCKCLQEIFATENCATMSNFIYSPVTGLHL